MGIEKYADIINMERPVSKRHTPMPLENRAAQFAPFAALTGYDDAVAETARLTEKRIELSEELKNELDMRLSEIAEHISEKPEISVTFFVQDETKDGGRYESFTGRVKKISITDRSIVFVNGEVILLDDILSLNSEMFRNWKFL